MDLYQHYRELTCPGTIDIELSSILHGARFIGVAASLSSSHSI